MIPLSKITPAPFQPRKTFDPEKMEELAASLEAQGLLHPILVRPLNGEFQLIAGERRFRAAKAIGWKEIRAEIEVMDDLEAEEKSAVENFHRGDLTGQEIEDVVYDLWMKGNPETGNGRYKTKESLSKTLGWRPARTSDVISAKESRERLGLKLRSKENKSVTTFDLNVTSGVTNDSDRKKLIALKTDDKITTSELVKLAPVIRDAPTDVKNAVLDAPKTFTPKVAAELSKLPDTVQLGAIATIKKGKMDEEDASEFVEEIQKATADVQKAMIDDPKHITPTVAKELSKLTTPASQQSTIETIQRHRLKEDEAVNVAKMMSGEIPGIESETTFAAEDMADMQRMLQRQQVLERDLKLSKKSKTHISHALQNIMAHMGIIQNVHNVGCSCPHCGKSAKQYLRWSCCDEGKNETLDKAFEYAKKQHAKIVQEETGKKVKWT